MPGWRSSRGQGGWYYFATVYWWRFFSFAFLALVLKDDDKCLVSRDRALLALRYASPLSRSCRYERGPTTICSTHSVNRVKEAVEYPPVDVVYIPVFLFKGRTCIALCSSPRASFTANFVCCCVQPSFVLDRGESKHHLVPKPISLVGVMIPPRADRVKALSNATSRGLDSTRPSQTCHYFLPPFHFCFARVFFFALTEGRRGVAGKVSRASICGDDSGC